ncbi:bifunctional UDP-sugar hydrolase/5'-nucleotidase [Nocardioides dubius]|uniref:bifunctional metallophosphatase/5'-nucleotidase n=1 Tax=Nocardioides dubius TaxID=317019 RepID=UPI0031E00BCB
MSVTQRRTAAGVAAVALTIGGLAAVATAPAQAAPEDVVDVQVLGINDFHGRISASSAEAGAAVIAGAVKELRAENPNTVFAAAGDLIGASTFESFINQDKPTIDALNEAGLDVSAVGNHEFDQGYDDLVNRVMAPYDADTNPFGGAEWEYIGANVKKKADGTQADGLEPSWVQTFGAGTAEEVQVGFIGAVTEHLDELVAPDGIADIEATDIVSAVNTEADALTADGVDIVVLLVHEGAATTAIESAQDPASDFGKIVNGVDTDVDAIISGHTHLAYNHTIGGRPVVSAGQYGYNLNQLQFSYDTATDDLVGVTSTLLPLTTKVPGVPPAPDTYPPNYPVDEPTKAIVDAAKASADVKGAVEIGDIAGPFRRPLTSSGSDNRGRESTLGNLVAEVQRAQTPAALGGAEIAFMNPGGLRKDMVGTGGRLTYRQAADVQPFANTLVRMELTGAQIKAVLEEQWQPAGASRPFLRLGVSEGFTYTYDPAKAKGARITRIWLDDVPLSPSATYAVTVNSFLASGGDNFTTLASGTNKKDTGVTDLQAMVDYLDGRAEPLTPDFTQHAVGVSPNKAAYQPGETAQVALSSLSYTALGDQVDATGSLSVAGGAPTSVAITTTSDDVIGDEVGQATLAVKVPASAVRGSQIPVTFTGDTTGTTVRFWVPVAPKTASTIRASVTPKKIRAKRTTVRLKVEVRGASQATGKVTVRYAGRTRTATLRNGRATLRLGTFKKPGKVTARISYAGNAHLKPATKRITFRIRR